MTRTLRSIAGITVLTAIAAAIVFLGRPTPKTETHAETSIPTAAEFEPAPVGAVGDETTSAATDHDDPVDAAIGFVTAPQHWLFLSPADLEVALAETVAADAPGLRERFRAEAAAAREGLGPTVGPVWFVIAPLAHRVESQSDDEAVVSVWSVSVLSAADVAASQATWSITTVRLVREQGRWKLQSFDDRPGPTPQLGVVDGPWSPERLADTLDGFIRVGEEP